MTPFDLPTVITYSGLMACLMGLILLFLERSYPAYIKGIRLWAIAPLIASLAVLSRVWLRSVAPDKIAIGAQNVFLIATAVFFLAGACEFFERPFRRRYIAALIGVAVLAMLVFSTYDGSDVHRRLFARTYLIALYGTLTWVIWQQPKSLATRLTAGVTAALVALLLARTLVGYVLPSGDGVDSHELLQLVYAVGFSSTDVLIPICAVLLITERLRFVLENLAMHDGLTGLLTHRALFEMGRDVFAGCRRQGTSLGVMLLDLDHFKTINDTRGHHVGDVVIKDFTARVQGLLRRPCIMGRYGGEEFVILLRDTSLDDMITIAERIRLSRTTRADIPACTVSIGIATLQPDTPTLEALIQKADEGMYRAKQLGRNRVEVA